MTHQDTAEALADVIYRHRTRRGWSVYDLARESGLSRSTMWHVGGTPSLPPHLPSLTTLLRLADALEVRASALLAEAEAVVGRDGEGGTP